MAAPGISDSYVPKSLMETVGSLPLIERTVVSARYPVMEIAYGMPSESVRCRLTAWNPISPFDSELSGIPCGIFEFDITNISKKTLNVSVLFALQNFISWDGINAISGNSFPTYGGNQTLAIENGIKSIGRHEIDGELSLTCIGKKVSIRNAWQESTDIWQDFCQDGVLTTLRNVEPSPAGTTWNGAVCSQHFLNPGETEVATFILSWRFPNRIVDFEQAGKPANEIRIGNHYCEIWQSTEQVNKFVTNEIVSLRNKTLHYRDSFFDSTLPFTLLDRAASNVSTLRSPVCFRDKNGAFFGFEGGCGAFSGGINAFSGCCPMNCSHVWAYDQTLISIWPDLFDSMRQTDWNINQHTIGYLPHRTLLPISNEKFWDRPIGGPEKPALDGLFASILKTVQQWQRTGNSNYFEHVRRAMRHIFAEHDNSGDGVIHGEQPCTYDISLFGPNPLIGGLYLATLKACSKYFANSDIELSKECEKRFANSKEGYERICWNGDYYRQVIELNKHPYQFGDGCLADQLLGQWWAHQLGLGYVFEKQNVQKTLLSIIKRNFCRDFEKIVQSPRQYASKHDRGVLNATYSPETRPQVPLLYSDEVWSGVEYALASLMIYEDMLDEGMQIVRAVADRYSGVERNPFNEIECGDHYVRSLSVMSVINAFTGITFSPGRIDFAPKSNSNQLKAPFFGPNRLGQIAVSSNDFLEVELTGIPSGYQIGVQIKDNQFGGWKFSKLEANGMSNAQIIDKGFFGIAESDSILIRCKN